METGGSGASGAGIAVEGGVGLGVDNSRTSACDDCAALTRGEFGGDRLGSEANLLLNEGKGLGGDDETKSIGLELLGDIFAFNGVGFDA